MGLSENLDMKGKLTVQKRDKSNKIVEQISASNNIVLSGRDLVAKLFINEQIAPISHVAVGIGTTKVDPKTDTNLNTELFRKAITKIDPTQDLTITDGGKIKVKITTELDFNEANDYLTEAGLFNANTGGVMYNRVVFPPINKTNDFKLTLIWEILF
ncbi:MAG: hypothetical protein EWV58_21975 [Microcystis aeruginosa Ma_MB_F_20061100_S19]|uniref:Uncharacterized protein n=1 Tax=Microcystis aeruginosa SPC777 TaxID=482300 RepID=S3K8P8_MICAE|nr:hypothetical protein [Microcystis aeruginosa]NCR99665.1 hypothetical protein [Microcystis aeruginosa L311-01]OCY13485.1 MAG: hypothetical protein BEV12_23380 [Microcystis aeruginosa CACIAM 03]TRU09496.1 MAG: hypothetical protein EWV58_21975 [Microcystis aeruginosa Ma_MB_F_20061100_S19]TRU16105.1 MAG: hypothetical protein EWV59_02540 [Microcystis aeruginosa Ma_MB_F_20061100_S19D]EPF21354.1 hypothetical protein MAESPC_02789 [Microcystis aeruginosa SPC777]